jgi:hypothetical protein
LCRQAMLASYIAVLNGFIPKRLRVRQGVMQKILLDTRHTITQTSPSDRRLQDTTKTAPCSHKAQRFTSVLGRESLAGTESAPRSSESRTNVSLCHLRSPLCPPSGRPIEKLNPPPGPRSDQKRSYLAHIYGMRRFTQRFAS